MFKIMLFVDGITERYWHWAVNAAKTNDGLRNAIKLQVFEASKHAWTFYAFENTRIESFYLLIRTGSVDCTIKMMFSLLYVYTFCLQYYLINIHIFRLSGLSIIRTIYRVPEQSGYSSFGCFVVISFFFFYSWFEFYLSAAVFVLPLVCILPPVSNVQSVFYTDRQTNRQLLEWGRGACSPRRIFSISSVLIAVSSNFKLTEIVDRKITSTL